MDISRFNANSPGDLVSIGSRDKAFVPLPLPPAPHEEGRQGA